MTIETSVQVSHIKIKLRSSFESFIRNLNALVNTIDVGYAKDVATEPRKTEDYLKSREGTTGLVIFTVQHHGELLHLKGKPRKALQYVIGNPLVAIQMTVHDIRSALYAPLRMIVYEDNGQSFVEYDQPSTLFGQFGNEDVLVVAKNLDLKLMSAITRADNAL